MNPFSRLRSHKRSILPRSLQFDSLEQRSVPALFISSFASGELTISSNGLGVDTANFKIAGDQVQADLGHGFYQSVCRDDVGPRKLLQKLVLAASNGQTTLASTIDMSALTSLDAGFLSQERVSTVKRLLVFGSNYNDNIVANVSFQIDDPYGLVRKGANGQRRSRQ